MIKQDKVCDGIFNFLTWPFFLPHSFWVHREEVCLKTPVFFAGSFSLPTLTEMPGIAQSVSLFLIRIHQQGTHSASILLMEPWKFRPIAKGEKWIWKQTKKHFITIWTAAKTFPRISLLVGWSWYGMFILLLGFSAFAPTECVLWKSDLVIIYSRREEGSKQAFESCLFLLPIVPWSRGNKSHRHSRWLI